MRILNEERIGLDVVSGGEIFAGKLAGVAPADMVFHGNNKSRQELAEGVAAGIGIVALDNDLEIDLLNDVARDLDRNVSVILRLNPGVDAHTHDKMRTGAADSKFGFPVADGQAMCAADKVAASTRLTLIGYHAHVGSQIFDPALVEKTIDEIMGFAGHVFLRHGIVPQVIIPGGGFGVADDASGADVSIEAWARRAAKAIRRACQRHEFDLPLLMVEPGRAIVGPAGVALYEVGARKSISGGRIYVSVNGGMSDNIRPALYGARYTASLASRNPEGQPTETVTIAGKYCESGDILIEDVELPCLTPGDVLAVPMVGAYCLAMASNYNLAPRPAIVLVRNGKVRVIRRRESYEDMLRCELETSPREPASERDCLSARKGSL